MKFLLALLFVAGLAGAAEAQTVSVDINRAVLLWNWTPTVESGPADEFRVYCGTATKTYTKMASVAGTAREVPVKAAIGGSGNWFCAVTAANKHGEGGASNEVGFDAGAAPAGTISLSLSAK